MEKMSQDALALRAAINRNAILQERFKIHFHDGSRLICRPLPCPNDSQLFIVYTSSETFMRLRYDDVAFFREMHAGGTGYNSEEVLAQRPAKSA